MKDCLFLIDICRITEIYGYIFSNTDYTDSRDFLAYAHDEHL
jgi:hypothetical protein